ncbi:hypothetical protein FIBSPDRAFT_936632 [Athelia psychrophila]|uniref:Uncharacterized protein n=1 Tax=Athelia psychrophila TaxID=1759441 RepID=A0A166BSC9_9AGAM|nr:hypothetical protein FIBSPDRAFT_936632 [Fibularhizoctonia sp. CBS 109695]
MLDHNLNATNFQYGGGIRNSPNEYEEHREFAAPDWTQPSFLINLLQRSKTPLEYLQLAVTMSESDLIECLTFVGGTLLLVNIRTFFKIFAAMQRPTPYTLFSGFTPIRYQYGSGPGTIGNHRHQASLNGAPHSQNYDAQTGADSFWTQCRDATSQRQSRWSDESHLSDQQWCSPNLTAFQWEVEQGVVPPADIRRLAKLKQAGMPISSGYLHDLFDS